MTESINSEISYVKEVTTKGKDCIICENFLYYLKTPINPNGSKRYVYRESRCTSSITLLEDTIVKVNSLKNLTIAAMHSKHYNNHEFFG